MIQNQPVGEKSIYKLHQLDTEQCWLFKIAIFGWVYTVHTLACREHINPTTV